MMPLIISRAFYIFFLIIIYLILLNLRNIPITYEVSTFIMKPTH